MEKAAKLEVESRAWLDLWKTATGGSQTVYIHLMCVHLPEQIRSLPVDPYYFQTSGLEHGNKMRKHIALDLTNHFVGRTPEQVAEEEGSCGAEGGTCKGEVSGQRDCCIEMVCK